jgi:hypothetical protein
MKNLYRVLACLAFMLFLTITGSLVLNTAINKSIKLADAKFESISKQYIANLGDDKFFDNLYFINCFPNVCAKVSHVRYEKNITTNTQANTTAENTEVEAKQSINKYRYDLGTTDFIVAKYSPLTNKITSNLNANNIILTKNNDILASAYFKSFNYEKSEDLISFYKNVFGISKDKSLNMSAKILIDTPRVSYDKFRAKADKLDVITKSYNETKTTVSSAVDFKLLGLTINNDPKKLDLAYDVKVENFDKKAVLEGLNNSNINLFTAALQNPKAQSEVKVNTVKYLNGIINGIKLSAENKTLITLNNFEVRETENVKDKTLDSSINFNGKISLDKNLDLIGNLNVLVKSTNIEDAQLAENIKVRDKETGKVFNVFVKQEDGSYISTVKFENGMAIFNNNKVNIKGKVAESLNFFQSMLSIFGMKLMLAE